jgi:hypothetical protein
MGFAAVEARLTIDGQELITSVDAQTKAAVFQARLTAGPHRISAKFFDARGRSLDAFYVYASTID